MKAPRIILRRHIPDDLGRIIDYLAQQSGETADRFALSVNITLDKLVCAPAKGSLKKFRAKKLAEIRTWPIDGFPNHLILYRVIDVGIEVLGIVHGARDLARILRNRV